MANSKNKKHNDTPNDPATKKRKQGITMDAAEIPSLTGSLNVDFPAISVTDNIGTRRRKAGERISNSAEKLRLIMNAALDAIICIDTKGEVIFWNPQAELIFGWTETEVVGKALSDLIIPEAYRQRHIEGMAHYLKTGKGPALNKLMELSAINHKAEEFPIELTIMPIKEGGEEFFCAFIRDITERKLTEEKMRQSEARLIEAQEVAKVGSWETDLSTLKVIWSEETFRIFEIDPAKFQISHPAFLEYVHPDDRAKVDAAFVSSLTDHSINTIEHRILTAGGDTKIVEERWQIFRNNEGQPVRAAGTCQDITERKKSEAALKKVYEEKNTILESIDDGFFAVDKNSIVTYWNGKAEILLGEKREDIIGKNLHEVFAPTGSVVFYDNYQKAIRENITIHFEEFSKRSNKWFAISAFGSEKGLSVHFKDITERKKAEDQVKESEYRYRSLIEQATDAICIADASMKIIDINPAGCQMLGYSKEEFLQLTIADLFIMEDLITNPIKIKELKTGKVIRNERRFKRKDGTLTELEINAKILEDGRFVLFAHDITERKEAEFRLKESNERFNLVSKATNDMVWDWDLVTGKVYRNKEGWRKIFRTGDKEIETGTTDEWDERIHPEDREKVKLINDQIKDSEKDFFEVECRVLRDDGTYAYIHDRGNIIRNELGKPLRLIGATQDITARKEAEMQVAKSELRFRSLVQNGSDLTNILDEKGHYLYSSPSAERILGYKPEYMAGKNAFSFIHPDNISIIKEHLSKKKTGKYLELSAFRFKNAMGEWRWLESKMSDMSDNPEVKGYVFNSRDITERKIAEEEIKKLSIIARETVNAVIITDPEEKILWVNEAFTSITEFEFEEVIGKRPGDFLQGEETNMAVVRFMRRKIKNIQPFECDILNYTKSGKKYWLRIQCQPQFDETGKLKGFFAIETDITKEKEAEEILKTSEERYRYLFNNNPVSIFIWDIETFKILEINDAAIEQYRYYREEFIDKNVLDLNPPEDHNKIEHFAAIARQKKEFRSEINCKHINKSGEEIHMNINSHLIQFKGRPAILALATNITDKIFLERELEKERLLKQQEITVAVISAQEQERQELGGELHDNINQILAGSRLYLGLAKKELNIEHPYLSEADNLITSAIDEIRNLSHSLIPPSLKESEFLEALENIIEVTQKTSGIIISMQAFSFDESCIADKLKLNIYRIVQEQLNNILKHAGAQKVIVRLVQDNEKILLSIKDDGAGFDTTKKVDGVGLMNMKTRASLFNGELTIISSPGRGCELRVLFN